MSGRIHANKDRLLFQSGFELLIHSFYCKGEELCRAIKHELYFFCFFQKKAGIQLAVMINYTGFPENDRERGSIPYRIIRGHHPE